MPLDGDEFLPAALFGQRIGFGKLPGEAVGNADGAHFSACHRPVQGFEVVGNRCAVVPHVADVEIDVIHAEILQAFVEHTGDMLTAADAGGNVFGRARQEFGGDDDFVALGQFAQRAAEVLFAGTALVADGGVEEVHAQFQTARKDGMSVVVADGPRVHPALAVTETHAAEADAGNG